MGGKDLFRSLGRSPARSFLLMGISFLLMTFVGAYLGNMDQNEQELETLGERLPVRASLTDPSGGNEGGLQIQEYQVDRFLSLGLSECVLGAESLGTMDSSVKSDEKITFQIGAANTLSLFDFEQQDLTMELDQAETMLQGKQALCLVEEGYLERFDKASEVGDRLELELYRPIYDDMGEIYDYERIGNTSLEIAGFFHGYQEGAFTFAPQMICSLEWLKQEYEKLDSKLTYSTASGIVAEPLKLNELKEQAKELYLSEISSLSDSYSRKGNSLMIDDQIFIQSASQIMANLELLRLFLPAVLLLIAALEITVFYFSTRSRRSEIYLARCLGKGKLFIAGELMEESFLLAFAGGVASLIILLLTGMVSWRMGLILFIMFPGSELLGALIPAAAFCRMNPMKIFQQRE